MGWNLGGLREEMESWGPFTTWLEREHPDEAAMIATRDRTPTYTAASLALWAKYVDEWNASQQ